MNDLLLLLALSTTSSQAQPPQEVTAFVADRDACDHFRGEPIEGDAPEQRDRRKFVQESLDIHCAGSDRRLAALKSRYSSNPQVMKLLNNYEPVIEGSECEP